MRLLFCSDIHGNELQYFKIFQAAKNYEGLIIGGDICPKGLDMQSQRTFLQNYLIPRLKELKETRPFLKIYIMFGNDDLSGNLDLLYNHNDEIYEILTEEKLPLAKDFFITGYPYVPITPFRMKDWEKWDLKDKKNRNLFELERKVLLDGITTRNMRYEGVHFKEDDTESIEKDLVEVFDGQPEKTLYVFHSPPFNTNLDITYSKDHVGSLAIRMAIEGFQPFLTLHGHIHETVEMSGKFMDRIGDSICAGVGNHNISNYPHVLEIDILSRSVRRIKLD